MAGPGPFILIADFKYTCEMILKILLDRLLF